MYHVYVFAMRVTPGKQQLLFNVKNKMTDVLLQMVFFLETHTRNARR